MTFFNKVKWVLGILMVFVLIITTNLIDKNNFVQVKNSVVTIYEDRLIANDLIFNLSRSIQEKEVALALIDTVFFLKKNEQVNDAIKSFILQFEQTELTVKEESIFGQLKNNLDALNRSENIFIQSNLDKKKPFFAQISKVKENLYDLSKIQLSEGGIQMGISKRAIDKVELFTQVEIYLLIFLAIVIQIVVMYRPKEI
jgi:hypothetical protein